ncbi:hypothetical protein, variant [Puccinia triticina 1-1 BBBD Race 1]|uniref:Uncharacterized protein n=2 Tax=Puccinia triticina TaxID=208348 RepID=A0A180GKD1_PUCT1|nr:uncharacterized protein PtA15_17A55 [Puccinia triticina]OAV93120.1 hypothetical protein PTTG_07241 [Puccinia triticina 1-1 BBBD Race 1]OAV93121.1 hypothetical protein, variant [Puccinia triticina 1-1 BBBD Race 1]WAQ92574.1 hypothetical protein PtA15_17A55 [Puccinia triticina]
MELYLRQLPMLDRSKSDLLTFPLPPTKDAQNSSGRSDVESRKTRIPRRSAATPKKLKSMDNNLAAALREPVHRGPTDENVFPLASTNSSSGSQGKGLLRLPGLQHDPAGDAQPKRCTIHSDAPIDLDSQTQPIKVAKSKCARYPITYKLKTTSQQRQILAAQANGAAPVLRVQSFYDESHCSGEPARPANNSSPDLRGLTTPSPTGQSYLSPLKQGLSSHWSISTRQSQTDETVHSLIPPPRSASIRYTAQRARSPARSSLKPEDTGGARVAEDCDNSEPASGAAVAENHEDAELELIQTVQLNLDARSDHTTISQKSSIIHRPRPLGRGRGQSFSTPYAEFDKLMTLKASGLGSSITPGRNNSVGTPSVATSQQSSSFRSLASSSSTLSDDDLRQNIRSSRSFVSDGASDRLCDLAPKSSFPRLAQAQRFSIASRRSFFSSLARLDSADNALNLDLHLPADPRNDKLGRESEAQRNNNNNKHPRGHRLKKKTSSFKSHKSNSTLRQENRNNKAPLPTIPDSFLQLSPKLPDPAPRGAFLPTSCYHRLRQIASLRSDRDRFNDHRQPQTKTRRKLFPCLDPRNFF